MHLMSNTKAGNSELKCVWSDPEDFFGPTTRALNLLNQDSNHVDVVGTSISLLRSLPNDIVLITSWKTTLVVLLPLAWHKFNESRTAAYHNMPCHFQGQTLSIVDIRNFILRTDNMRGMSGSQIDRRTMWAKLGWYYQPYIRFRIGHIDFQGTAIQ